MDIHGGAGVDADAAQATRSSVGTSMPGNAEVAHAPQVAIEEILGWDPARGVMVYVERAPSGVAGFDHAALVEVARAGGPPRRVALTTDTDVAQVRGASAATRAMVRSAIEARVLRDVAAARARLQACSLLPVSLRGAAGAGSCRRAPFEPREFDVGEGIVGRVVVTPDATRVTVTLHASGRASPESELPSVTLTSAQGTTQAPYDRIADAREIPGTDLIALLLRSDACTPEGTRVPARGLIVSAPPPPETPLRALVHAELAEVAVMRALAPRARRRTVDEVSGYFEGRARVVFDNAWVLPPENGAERILVQFTRQSADLSPLVADAGQANTGFAIVTRGAGGRLRVIATLVPPFNENVFEGTGQEAFATDLDGDGRPEVIVRARHGRGDEVTTLLRVAGDRLQYVWRGISAADDRAAPLGAQAQVRRCTVGVDNRTLVLRCIEETYPARAPAEAPPTTIVRVVQRVQWNGGVVTVTEERR